MMRRDRCAAPFIAHRRLPNRETGMGDGAAICFGCAGTFARDALKEVGDALFCVNCFARLLAPVADRDRTEELLSRPRPVRPTPDLSVPTLAMCFLCGEPAGADAFVRLREFTICRSCSEELTRDMQPAGA